MQYNDGKSDNHGSVSHENGSDDLIRSLIRRLTLFATGNLYVSHCWKRKNNVTKQLPMIESLGQTFIEIIATEYLYVK